MKKGNFWPTRPQELLLAAALGDEQEAKSAWDQWLAIAEQTEFDAGSRRLAPLVYTNLVGYGLEHPHLSRFKGLYRRTWYYNQLLLRRASDVLELFVQNDIPTLLFKGIALSLTVYRDLGARAMSDIDLAVPPDYAALASRLLLERDWSPDMPFDEIRADRVRSATFRTPDGVELDLHFSLFESLDEGLNWADSARVWQRARAITVGQAQSLTPCAEDQLLHTIAHGLRSNPVPPIRWIADAVGLIRIEAPIDWNMLLDHADAIRLTFVVQRALTYLSEKFDCVPIEVLERVSRPKPSLLERFLFYIGRTRRVPLIALARNLSEYANSYPKRPWFVFGFLQFLRDKWQKDSLTATIRHLLKRGSVRLWQEYRSRAQYTDSPHKTRAPETKLPK